MCYPYTYTTHLSRRICNYESTSLPKKNKLKRVYRYTSPGDPHKLHVVCVMFSPWVVMCYGLYVTGKRATDNAVHLCTLRCGYGYSNRYHVYSTCAIRFFGEQYRSINLSTPCQVRYYVQTRLVMHLMPPAWTISI